MVLPIGVIDLLRVNLRGYAWRLKFDHQRENVFCRLLHKHHFLFFPIVNIFHHRGTPLFQIFIYVIYDLSIRNKTIVLIKHPKQTIINYDHNGNFDINIIFIFL